MDNELQELKRRVDSLEKLLKMKILGNDTSTNYGLPAQTVLYGLQQAGQLSLSKNGVTTSINNDTDPDLGETVSLESVDNTIPHGDKLAIAPNALFILAWNGTAYQVIAFAADDGAGNGNITVTNNSATKNVLFDSSTPQLAISDSGTGDNSSLGAALLLVKNAILSGDCNAKTFSVNSVPGVDATVVAGAVTLTFDKGILVSVV